MGSTEYKRDLRGLLVANGRLPSDHRVVTTRLRAACSRPALAKDKPLENEAMHWWRPDCLAGRAGLELANVGANTALN